MDDDWKILIEFCKEEWSRAMHHEQQRATMTNFVILISSAIIGFVAQKGLTKEMLPLALLLILLGVWGSTAILKLYERHDFHISRMRQWRAKIDQLHPTAELLLLKDAGFDDHVARYPKVSRIRLHIIWICLHLAIALIGCVMTIVILTN